MLPLKKLIHSDVTASIQYNHRSTALKINKPERLSALDLLNLNRDTEDGSDSNSM